MTVVFTLTKHDTWRYHKHATWKAFQRHWVDYLVRWTLAFIVSWLGCTVFWRLLQKDFLLCLVGAFIQCLVGAISYALNTKGRYFKNLAKAPTRLGERVVTLGRFDVYWGSPSGGGHYYHWTTFRDIEEADAGLYLSLGAKGTLVIPRSAFPNAADAHAFTTLARRRWEAMQQRQQSQAQETVKVWPPAPLVEL